MENNRKEELKNKIEEVVKEKLAKFRELIKSEEEEVEEEEVCIEPFKLLDPEEAEISDEDMLRMLEELCKEEGIELQYVNEIGEIHEFTNLSDAENVEDYPIVHEDEIAYIPINEVELEEEEMEELSEIAENMDLQLIPCQVLNQERFLIDKWNCNMYQVPLLGLTLVSPINLEILTVKLEAKMHSLDELEIAVAFKDVNENRMVVYAMDMKTLEMAGLVYVVGLEPELELSPAEFRGITSLVSLDELNKLCEECVE